MRMLSTIFQRKIRRYVRVTDVYIVYVHVTSCAINSGGTCQSISSITSTSRFCICLLLSTRTVV